MVQRSTGDDDREPVGCGPGDMRISTIPLTQRRGLSLGGVLLLAAVCASFLAPQAKAQQSPPPASALPAVPVSIGKSERQDVPVWLRGLGTVQALNTVTVRTRVDGTLDKFPVT